MPIKVDRPVMPGYGILPADSGSGLLDWDATARRLAESRNYWVGTVWPDGRPHVWPVWAIWRDETLWFSASLRSRKVRNLQQNPQVVVTADDSEDPIVVEGRAEIVADMTEIEAFLAATNKKYEVTYAIDFLDPAVNATVRVTPSQAFALVQADFAGSPTRWRFDAG
jgi:PPOX class probable F420-dependent enzyme